MRVIIMKKETKSLARSLAKKSGIRKKDARRVLKALGVESSLSEALEVVDFKSLNVDSLKLGIRIGKSSVAV